MAKRITNRRSKQSTKKAKPARKVGTRSRIAKPAKRVAARKRKQPVARVTMAPRKPAAPPEPVPQASGAPIPPELLNQGHGGFEGSVAHEHTKPPDARAMIRARQQGR